MKAARLYGAQDLRIDTLPVPSPGPGELLVKVEACGVCPTDARKFRSGMSSEADYPFNPGHEWIGHVTEIGAGVTTWRPGDRLAGDTYAGYADYAVIPAEVPDDILGAIPIDTDLDVERAVFLEPTACCLHALHDQAEIRDGDKVAVFGAGQMGIQLTSVAAAAGARVLVVEPRGERREVAASFGAERTISPEEFADVAAAWTHGQGLDLAVLSVGIAGAVAPAMAAVRRGGGVMFFAGFGSAGRAELDLNDIHYREIRVIGATGVGYTRAMLRTRYAQANELLASGALPLERLITHRGHLEDLPQFLEGVASQQITKAIVTMEDVPS